MRSRDRREHTRVPGAHTFGLAPGGEQHLIGATTLTS
jgi:hypothetical protein